MYYRRSECVLYSCKMVSYRLHSGKILLLHDSFFLLFPQKRDAVGPFVLLFNLHQPSVGGKNKSQLLF